MSRVIGIDPGNEQTAWCALRCGRPVLWGKEPNNAFIERLRSEWSPVEDVVSIEMIASYGMPVGREVFETCLWIGRFQEAWGRRGGNARLVYRREVKLYLCESTRANDANIRAALIDRYGPGKDAAIGRKAAPGPLYGLKGDEWSALAIALTCGPNHSEV